MRRRPVDKHIRLSAEEADGLARKAQMTCLPEGALIRMLLKGYEPKEKPDARFYEVMRELSAIGNNIHQLAAKANALNFIDAPALAKETERWHRFQADVELQFLRPDKTELKWQ